MPLRRLVALLVGLPLLLPAAASAQSASVDQDTQLRIEAKRKRLIVRPDPPVAAAVREAGRVADRATVDRLVQESVEPGRRRPALDYDVTGAITARNAQRALRR
jgi:hypothetical protein